MSSSEYRERVVGYAGEPGEPLKRATLRGTTLALDSPQFPVQVVTLPADTKALFVFSGCGKPQDPWPEGKSPGALYMPEGATLTIVLQPKQ